MAKLSDNEAQFFLDKNFGAVATLREDGSPLVTPVWVDYDGENVVFNTASPRAKWKHLKRDLRVAIEVHPVDDPYKYVTVSGTAELVKDEEEANRHIDKLTAKYRGIPSYQGTSPVSSA